MDPVSLDLASAVTAARSVRVLWSRLVQMSFLGLSVLPELRLTDKGLVDVEAFELVPVAVD
jgi:adenine deaminase